MALSTKKLPGRTWEGTAQHYHRRVQSLKEQRANLKLYNEQAFSRGYQVGVAAARAELRDKAEDDTAVGAQASRIADTAIELAALLLRDAQLAAVLRELDVKRSEPRDDFDRGADAARAMIRRAIEEAA